MKCPITLVTFFFSILGHLEKEVIGCIKMAVFAPYHLPQTLPGVATFAHLLKFHMRTFLLFRGSSIQDKGLP